MPESLPIHSVPQAAAGYLYQARIALVTALRYSYKDSTVAIAIEKYDDVSFEKKGTPIELLQTKHHVAKTGNLTDSSADLWRTLRVWVNAVKDDSSLLGLTRFLLITTAVAPKGSAASLLRPYYTGSRNPDKAEVQLVQASTRSKNKDLAEGISAFLSLTQEKRKALLKAVEVIDRAPLVGDIDNLIEEELRMFGPRSKIALAREMIEGWWMSRICFALQCTSPEMISILDIENKLDDIRESLRRDSLPFNMELEDLSKGELSGLDEMCFVRQLRTIGIGADRLTFAKRDFYLASEQRSYWARKNLILDDEVGKFDKTLIEEWEPRFAQMCDELSECCCEEALRKAGNRIYVWVENQARFPIRTDTKRFFTVGSYHILADDLRVGWHRDYRTMCRDNVNRG